jgi:predicted Zn-dependent protease
VRRSRREALAVLIGSAGAVLVACEQEDLTRAALTLVPPETMAKLGQETWVRIRQQVPPSPDDALQTRLAQIGQRIVAASDATATRWQFVVFRSPQINAFALPGGYIGFFEGMFTVARNDAQVAAVMGHEVGHVNAHHGAQRLAAGLLKDIGLKALLFALEVGDVAYANEIATVLGAGIEFGLVLPYSRQQEYEADRLGVAYMRRAGYPPAEAVRFWRAMMALNAGRERPLEFLSTHPADAKRLAALEALLGDRERRT